MEFAAYLIPVCIFVFSIAASISAQNSNQLTVTQASNGSVGGSGAKQIAPNVIGNRFNAQSGGTPPPNGWWDPQQYPQVSEQNTSEEFGGNNATSHLNTSLATGNHIPTNSYLRRTTSAAANQNFTITLNPADSDGDELYFDFIPYGGVSIINFDPQTKELTLFATADGGVAWTARDLRTDQTYRSSGVSAVEEVDVP